MPRTASPGRRRHPFLAVLVALTFAGLVTAEPVGTDVAYTPQTNTSISDLSATENTVATIEKLTEAADRILSDIDLTRRAADDCLARHQPARVVITGVQGPKLNANGSTVGTGDNIDLTGASWAFGGNEAKANLQPNAGANLCVVGGRLTRTQSHDDTTWDQWHDIYTFMIDAGQSKVMKTELSNVGDGFVLGSDASDFLLQGVRVTRAHDDCVQNDHMVGGTIDDSFFDGCYVFYSARQGPGSPADGTGRTVRVTNSLVRMEAMPHVFDPPTNGPGPGHGPIWKMGNGHNGTAPGLAIHNTTIRVDQLPAHGQLGIPTYDHDDDSATPSISYLDGSNCSNNVIVWTGPTSGAGSMTRADWEAAYPSSCFDVVSDIDVWNDAVAAWLARHPEP